MSTELANPDPVAALVAEVKAARLPPPTARRRIRERAGVSLRDAAAALGVHAMTVHRWETSAEPNREHAIAYRRLLEALEEAVA